MMDRAVSNNNILLKNPDIIYRFMEDRLYILLPEYHNDGSGKPERPGEQLLWEGDRIAAHIWELIDGTRTLRDIIDILKTKYQSNDGTDLIRKDARSFCNKALKNKFIRLIRKNYVRNRRDVT